LLREALIQSYNVSTARLGLAVGLNEVAHTLRKLGLSRSVARYPSLLLGAVELSPYEVSQIYQTLASGADVGFRVPLRAIRQVMDHKGELLQQYPLQFKHTVDPAAIYLLTAALHEVTQQGTARILKALLPSDLRVAGKTGTSDDWRDSWFAGFSGEHLAVVWIGLDDNRPTGLTGTTGALTVWADIIGSIPTKALDRAQPANVEWVLIDPASGLRAGEGCQGAEWVPFIKNTAPTVSASCAREMDTATNNILNWIKGF
jgi:penicillin-binding protein 1B